MCENSRNTDSLITMEPSVIFNSAGGPVLHETLAWLGKHNPVSFIDVGPHKINLKLPAPGAVTKNLVHCACKFPWYVKMMMYSRKKEIVHGPRGLHDTQCIVNP